MTSVGDVRDWCAAIDQVLGGLVVQTLVHCYPACIVDASGCQASATRHVKIDRPWSTFRVAVMRRTAAFGKNDIA